jgi:hypothetical protein
MSSATDHQASANERVWWYAKARPTEVCSMAWDTDHLVEWSLFLLLKMTSVCGSDLLCSVPKKYDRDQTEQSRKVHEITPTN